jgi:hypothetical protein
MILQQQLVRRRLSLKEAIQVLSGRYTQLEAVFQALAKTGVSLGGQEVKMVVYVAGVLTI